MSGLQHKMYNYGVTPPAGVWEKIAAELDESELGHPFPSRLHDLAVTPPAGIWQKIETTLDAEQETVKPLFKKRSLFIRYAAAAAVIALLVWGGMQLLNNNKTTDTNLANEEQVIPKENNTSSVPAPVIDTPGENSSSANVTASADDARNEAALEASKKTYASLSTPVISKIKNASDFYFIPEEPLPGGQTRGLRIEDYYPSEPEAEENLADRYFMLMTPDGNIIRMSKKLGNLICCVSGEEQDADCIKQMKKWREKIASPSAGHSSGNLMDILSLLNSLQENNL